MIKTVCLILWSATTAWAQGQRWIVAFDPATTVPQRRQICQSRGFNIVEEIGDLNAMVVEQGPVFSPNAFDQMQSDPRISGMEQDLYLKWIEEAPASLEQVPLPSLGSILENLPAPRLKPSPTSSEISIPDKKELPWGIGRVNAPGAWPRTKGAGVKVAVVDTGIDPSHPDLAGRVAGGYDARLFHNNWKDEHGHGTHVSGIIAGQGLESHGIRVFGVAPEVQLYAVRVLDKNGSGFMTSIVRGILWCADDKHRMDVANMSLGSPTPSFLIHMALKHAYSKGVTFIVAAGNSGGSVQYPARYDQSIAVSAGGLKDHADYIAEFSSRGRQVAFIAPGVDVLSSVLGGNYEAWSGTSMAAPHVTGLAALAVGLGVTGPENIRAALKAAAEPIPTLSPSEQGAGMINAGNLVSQR